VGQEQYHRLSRHGCSLCQRSFRMARHGFPTLSCADRYFTMRAGRKIYEVTTGNDLALKIAEMRWTCRDQLFAKRAVCRCLLQGQRQSTCISIAKVHMVPRRPAGRPQQTPGSRTRTPLRSGQRRQTVPQTLTELRRCHAVGPAPSLPDRLRWNALSLRERTRHARAVSFCGCIRLQSA
jgi:hypothetical protein